MRTAFSVLLFVLAGLLTPQVASQEQQLDTAPNAFDDQYVGCIEKMERVAPQLLEEDMHMNESFRIQWEKAEQHWRQIKNTVSYSSLLNDFHGTALVAYTGDIADDFNRAVRTFRLNQYNFYFKGFHYYLTRALQLLSTNNCYLVYRASETRFTYSGTGNARFGHFISSSLNSGISEEFLRKSGTLFIIKSCLGVNIKDISLDPEVKEFLIPGYEVYQRVTITTKPEETYNTIELEEPQSMTSKYNCFYENYDSSISGADITTILPSLSLQAL
ncbi:T-cell ecto-ADP-ribosyltransferase 2-like [Ochotona curzoniae]|uniref:T-cell ecto-ADP-ribosyltransferase 2-like n=1 Tax=Ochotona curzoniae TaxID=130825 RepID=UPI001B352DF0|nr:T-cell ecto-ADP-ribosyltransferase 2-like [Ochotona curzoniae]